MSIIMDNYIREAIEQNSKEIAKRMLLDGCSIELIAKCTKLSLKDIESLQKEITE